MTNTEKEILKIAREYHRQQDRGRIDTPGGLEHMGDVWELLLKWERQLIDEYNLPQSNTP